ncbi:MAG: Crp/Fnr family transcriptional regulator [Dehalococcoidia bacterium]|nr:Crp/Fnr family transcriptional regulator [Dehalococcoidia bacterium]
MTIENAILSSIPYDEQTRLMPHLSEMEIVPGMVLHASRGHVEHLYFLDDGLVSLAVPLLDGRAIEGVTIGREGAVGIHALAWDGPSPASSIVHVRGRAKSLPVEVALDLLGDLPDFTRRLARNASLQFEWALQTAACNAAHSVRQRLAHWLLLFSDQTGTDRLALTHELLATVLGVSCQQLSVVANGMRRAGHIDYHHAHLVLTDRRALESDACECYEILSQQLRLVAAE